MYHVIYDGDCNLCVNLVKALETLDQGQRFRYIPMQDEMALEQLDITPKTCELGLILIDVEHPHRRWQGSAAAEEIARLLPMSQPLVEAYLSVPGLKQVGDRLYEQVRDNRYQLFGKRSQVYQSAYPASLTEVGDRSGQGSAKSSHS